MRLRQTTLSPLLRSLAAATLIACLTAQLICTAQCSLCVGDCVTENALCHGAVAASHHDDGDSPTPAHDDSSNDATCITLKTALVTGGALASVQPDLLLLYTPPPFALALNMTE